MADRIEVDDTELRALAVDLGRAAARATPLVDDVLEHAASNVKDEMVEDAEGSRSFRGIARTISYDRTRTLGGTVFEVGPDKSRGGAARLGVIAYFGGANGGGGTLDIERPLRSEGPRMMQALDRALGDVL